VNARLGDDSYGAAFARPSGTYPAEHAATTSRLSSARVVACARVFCHRSDRGYAPLPEADKPTLGTFRFAACSRAVTAWLFDPNRRRTRLQRSRLADDVGVDLPVPQRDVGLGWDWRTGRSVERRHCCQRLLEREERGPTWRIAGVKLTVPDVRSALC
jgi:hypothetical protein